jgi:hypothetical protein
MLKKRTGIVPSQRSASAGVAVPDIQGDGDAVNALSGADDPETGSPDKIPKASGFILPVTSGSTVMYAIPALWRNERVLRVTAPCRVVSAFVTGFA